MAKRKKKYNGGRTDGSFYDDRSGTEGMDSTFAADQAAAEDAAAAKAAEDARAAKAAADAADAAAAKASADAAAAKAAEDASKDAVELTPLQKAVNFANTGPDNLTLARYIRDNNVDLNALAGELGVDVGVANTLFTALTDENTAKVYEYSQNNPNATDKQLANLVKETGADIGLVADAFGIERSVGEQMYTDALGAGGQTEKVAATKVAGIEEDTPGTYTPPVVDTVQYISQPQVQAIDVSQGVTAAAAIEKLDAYVDIPAPPDVTATEITTAVANVKNAITQGNIEASQYDAALAGELNRTVAALGTQRPPITVQELRDLSSRAQAAQMGDTTAGMAQAAEFTIDPNAFVPGVTAASISIAATPEIEKQQRTAITGTAGTAQEAQILGTVNYEAAQARAIKGEAAKGAAASMVAEVGAIPDAVATTIVEDPATVTAALDTQSITVQAAVAALPTEALVSSQLETLLGGLESGQVPTWAKPAVDLVESRLAERGMATSTVARDSLFNAIIQTALPIADANAQALQQRATQNLSNEQQANIQTAQLESNRRLQNLANQQTAASQTAQMAQNMAQLQSQFRQDAALLTAQQGQQVRTQNLTNRQRTAEVNAQNQQAMNALNLSNEQQISLANLEVENLTARENMTAQNQEKLAEFQVAADFLSKNAAFKQQMELANLDASQQVTLANLTALNNAGSDNLSAAQQTELANLNTRMETNLAQAQIAQSMGIAQLNVNQQRAVENARMVANIDLTKFNADQQVQLANSQFMQTVTLTDFNARQQAAMQNATSLASLDLAAVDQRTRLAIENANNFLQMDIANLSNEQQAVILDQQSKQQRLLSDQSATNAAAQFNAATEAQVAQFNTNLAAQMEQFNASQTNAMAQFNTTEKNRIAAIEAGNEIDVAKFNNQLMMQLEQFNSSMDQQREMWNSQNAQAIEQSNIEWRRQANTITTAAENASNATAAQQAYNLSTQELANVWQQLRDDASYARTAFENEEQRKTTLYATALANDPGAAGDANYIDKLVGIADKILET